MIIVKKILQLKLRCQITYFFHEKYDIEKKGLQWGFPFVLGFFRKIHIFNNKKN